MSMPTTDRKTCKDDADTGDWTRCQEEDSPEVEGGGEGKGGRGGGAEAPDSKAPGPSTNVPVLATEPNDTPGTDTPACTKAPDRPNDNSANEVMVVEVIGER